MASVTPPSCYAYAVMSIHVAKLQLASASQWQLRKRLKGRQTDCNWVENGKPASGDQTLESERLSGGIV